MQLLIPTVRVKYFPPFPLEAITFSIFLDQFPPSRFGPLRPNARRSGVRAQPGGEGQGDVQGLHRRERAARQGQVS